MTAFEEGSENQGENIIHERRKQDVLAGYFRQALGEVAETKGGTEFRELLLDLAQQEHTDWPHPGAIEFLEKSYPEAVSETFRRMKKIQDEALAAQVASWRRERWGVAWHAMWRGMKPGGLKPPTPEE